MHRPLSSAKIEHVSPTNDFAHLAFNKAFSWKFCPFSSGDLEVKSDNLFILILYFFNLDSNSKILLLF